MIIQCFIISYHILSQLNLDVWGYKNRTQVLGQTHLKRHGSGHVLVSRELE